MPDGPDWVVAARRRPARRRSRHRARAKYALLLLDLRVQRRGEACASLQLDAKAVALPLRRQTSAPRPFRGPSGSPGLTRTTRTASACIDGRCRMVASNGAVATTTAPDVRIPGHRAAAVSRVLLLCLRVQLGRRSVCDRRSWLAQRDDDDGLPTAPRTVTASPANTAARVSWSAPTSEAGSRSRPMSRRRSPADGPVQRAVLTSCGITGLTNGTAYTFTVAARNPRDDGLASTPSSGSRHGLSRERPRWRGRRPRLGRCLLVRAASNGGSAVISYTAKVSPGGSTCTTSVLTCTMAA